MSDIGSQPYPVSYPSHHRLHAGQHMALPHRTHASIDLEDVPWHPGYRSPMNMSSPQHSRGLFATAYDYPSPPQSLPSPTYGTSPSASSSYDSPCEQIESSIGPSRVTTRGQRRAIEASSRKNYSTVYTGPPSTSPRPHSPRSVSDPAMSPAQRERFGPSMSMSSPRALAYGTPESSFPSPTSPYTYYAGSSYHPRSASPALSTVTSVSSNSNQAFAAPHHDPQVTAVFLPRQKLRKQRLFNVDRKAICEYSRDNPGVRQEDIAAQYGVERSTISKILKNKQKWLSVAKEEDVRIIKQRPSKFPGIEENLIKWMQDSVGEGISLTDALLRATAKDIAKNLKIPEDKFKASTGWLENFKHRHGIRNGLWEGNGSNTSTARALGAALPSTDSPAPTDLLQDESVELDPMSADAAQLSSSSPGDEHMDAATHDAYSRPGRPSFRQAWHGTPQLTPNPPTNPPMLIDQSPSAELSPPKSPVTFRNGRPDGSPPDPIDLDIAVVPAGELIIPPDDAQLPPMEHRRPVARMFSDGLVYYEAAPSIPDNAIPDMAEAEDIINKLIQFFERGQGMNILSTTERSSLHTIKCALFQAASGLPYTREQR